MVAETLTPNERRSQALKGRTKSFETRAAMHASHIVPRVQNPYRWRMIYHKHLLELRKKRDLMERLGLNT